MRCVRCKTKEAFDTKGVPINIEVRGEKRVTLNDPQICQDCVGEIWQAEDNRTRLSLPPERYLWPRS